MLITIALILLQQIMNNQDFSWVLDASDALKLLEAWNSYQEALLVEDLDTQSKLLFKFLSAQDEVKEKQSPGSTYPVSDKSPLNDPDYWAEWNWYGIRHDAIK